MNILIAGLVLFIGIHLVPVFSPVKLALQNTLGAGRYKGAFALAAAIGLGLIIWGMILAPEIWVFTPVPWVKSAAIITMPVVMILLAAAHMKGRIRQVTRHPMMLGVLIWAALHYAANGDLASIYLFGGFVLFAAVSMISSNMRGEAPAFEVTPKHDIMAIGGGLAVYAIFLFLHPWLFGVKII